MYEISEKKILPTPPKWTHALGVGVVVIGLAIGTGELIMWPHLVTKHGLGILWMALIGITFQYFINQEVARHTLATGESFFTSSSRLLKWFAPFWFLTAILLYIWPGWAGAIGTTLTELIGFGDYKTWAWASLCLVLILTYTGKTAYNLLEKSLKITVPTFFILLVIASIANLSIETILMGLKGLINFGFIPSEIDMNVLLGAIVFAGAGGLLNLCLSLWYRDKEAGMGKYIGKITNPITGKTDAVSWTSYTFDSTDPENLKNWKKWMNYVRIDQGVIFWFLGILTLTLLCLNAYSSLVPKGLVPEGTSVAVVQAHIFGDSFGSWGFNLFLIMAFLMLFSVMWTVIDAFTRIITDIIYVNSHTGSFSKHLSFIKNISIHKIYYLSITAIVITSAILVPMKQPLTLLTLSAILGGFSMAVYVPVLLYINNYRLPRPLRPGWISNIILSIAGIFYIFFVIYFLVNLVN